MGIRREALCYVVTMGDIEAQSKVTSTAVGITHWIRSIRETNQYLNEIFVGVDAQCMPSGTDGYFGQDIPVAVLSLNVGHSCIIFQIFKCGSIPPDLHDFLANRRLRFVGMDILNTAYKLFRDYGLRFSCALDLRHIVEVKMHALERRNQTLEDLVNAVLHGTMPKRHVGDRDWGGQKLSMAQIELTTTNAYKSSHIAMQLYYRQYN